MFKEINGKTSDNIIIDPMYFRWKLLGVLMFFYLLGCSRGNTLAPLVPTVASEDKQLNLVSPEEEDPHRDQDLVENLEKINQIDGAVLILIPAGGFEMGAEPESGLEICAQALGNCTEQDFLDESPPHWVEVNAFWIYRTEVTTAQYILCVSAGVCSPPALTEFFEDQRFLEHPVINVNWFAADLYCRWAGGRLPSEAEWEKAARGQDGRVFPWGNKPECGLANVKGCTQGLTAPVGSFPLGTSPYGIHDLAGNVLEWVADWYSEDYYMESSQIDPTGPSTGELRVARGGSWKNPFTGIRSTNRTANFPEVFSTGVGFRCVIDTSD